jgi:hypothetical protein
MTGFAAHGIKCFWMSGLGLFHSGVSKKVLNLCGKLPYSKALMRGLKNAGS